LACDFGFIKLNIGKQSINVPIIDRDGSHLIDVERDWIAVPDDLHDRQSNSVSKRKFVKDIGI